nr:hypothetical protein Iba_scaffold10625CG0010 [Ipomoea batatas]
MPTVCDNVALETEEHSGAVEIEQLRCLQVDDGQEMGLKFRDVSGLEIVDESSVQINVAGEVSELVCLAENNLSEVTAEGNTTEKAAYLLCDSLNEDELDSSRSSMKLSKERNEHVECAGVLIAKEVNDDENSEIGEESSPVNNKEGYVEGGNLTKEAECFVVEEGMGPNHRENEEEDVDGDSVNVGEGDSAVGYDDEAENPIIDEHQNAYVEDEDEMSEKCDYAEVEECSDDGNDAYSECEDEYDGIAEDDNVDDGEYDEYEFNCDEWLDWLEEKLRYARGRDLMNEVLKEVYSYMQVVYDEVQQVHWEDECSMALKGCIILREIVKASPMRGILHPESELGYHLLMNEEVIGRRLCRWAWRRFRRGWEEKLRRLDVNFYCN